MPRKDASTIHLSAQAQQDLVSEGIENFELPKSLVTKIAKSAIPDNVKLQKETVLSLVKGSTVFINYLAATAHDVAQSKQHKSISASDVLKALEMIEFGDLVEPLQAELQIYRDIVKGRKISAVDKSAPASKGKGKEVETSSLAPRSKGKERQAPLPPFTSTAVQNEVLSSISRQNDEEPANGFEDDGDAVDEGFGDEDEGLGDEEVNEYDDDVEEEEEPVDTMAVEGEEIRYDQPSDSDRDMDD